MQNAVVLEAELAWLRDTLQRRLKWHFRHEDAEVDVMTEPPELEAGASFYADFIHYYNLDAAERIVLLLALVPHVRPQLLDVFLCKNPETERAFTEFGGVTRGTQFFPTVETALFVLAGEDLESRFRYQQIFESDYVLREHHLLIIERDTNHGSLSQGCLCISDEIRGMMTSGIRPRPDFGPDFPARRLTTTMQWADLILDEYTKSCVGELKAWLHHGQTMLADPILGKQVKPGYRCLFHGPPGTGKTLCATLLGQHAQRDVYRVDLSQIVSKYIGETEKNLEKVFQQAENRDWILFFDEADALFGKRTQLQDAHDRYANQEVSYLLQRVEDFAGITILATNFRGNLDDAFARRFQSIIHFPLPGPDQRLQLWQQGFSPNLPHAVEADITDVADNHELSGGSIINIIRWCTMISLDQGKAQIDRSLLEEGIRKELVKEGR